jgi:DNA-binding NtrC family response regulator
MTPDRPTPSDEHSEDAVRVPESFILLVDDDDVMRGVTRRTLELRGYDVVEAHDGEEALALLGRHAARVRMVLCDLVMPKMNGWVLGGLISGDYPEMKVLYMSGYSDLVAVFGAGLAHGAAWIRKPFTADDLIRRVRDLVGPAPSRVG